MGTHIRLILAKSIRRVVTRISTEWLQLVT